MNIMFRNILRTARKLNRSFLYDPVKNKENYLKENKVILDPDLVNKEISQMLLNNDRCLISRFGRNELNLVKNYIGYKNKKLNYLDFIQYKSPANWIEDEILKLMHSNAGFFHNDLESIEKFSDIYLQNLPKIDLLGVNMIDPNQEHYFKNYIKDSKKVDIEYLTPFFSEKPWTLALKGKKVLVIHPFSDLIVTQYKKRDDLFKNKILPDFELKTFTPVVSFKGEEVIFSTWFAALDEMKHSVDQIDFDIALVACGAYGLPLSTHIKSIGKKAFHLGGVLQLLFGIIGTRWENYKYSKFGYNYNHLFNRHWVKPTDKHKPKNANNIENGTYW